MSDQIIPHTKLQYRDHEIAAYKKAGYFQSSLLQQNSIQLIAPDVQYQLQELANEIAGDNGVDMAFRVHIINNDSWYTYSFGSGDIFIPLLKLDMVENRDEIAFVLAREVGVQHMFLHLSDMEESYTDKMRDDAIAIFSNIVISSAINGIFNYFVVSPIHEKIMDQIIDDPKVSRLASTELRRIVRNQYNSRYRYLSDSVSTILGDLLGKIPGQISKQSSKLVQHMITVANEDANISRRTIKDEWGLLYMSNAGYDPLAGKAVIKKINQVEVEIKAEVDVKKEEK